MRYANRCLPLALVLLSAAPARPAEKTDYLREIKPILQARCYACHGALRQKAGLRLDTGELIRQGGDSGPAIVAGQSAASLLIHAVTGRNDVPHMPPRSEGEPLAEGQIALLRNWIDQGAIAPPEPVPEDPRKHWSFRPPVRPLLPAVADLAWADNPIDRFLAAEQARHQITPAPPAAKPILLRRVYLDLIGLPPTRDELIAFLADDAPDAYAKAVERLLASPQYGERWARHWMDVWRYSDWYGRRAEKDVRNSAPQIWHWRDWIVTSLNQDKGYDRMVQEMLAADEVTPGDDAAAVATGYIARSYYSLNPDQWMRDLVEHTGKAFLGLTFNCALCHDHKYDPISQEEYFRFRAFFEPVGLRQDRVPGEADPGPFEKYIYPGSRKVIRIGTVSAFDETPEAPTYMYHKGDERSRMEGKPPVRPGAPAFLNGDRLPIEPVALTPVASYPGLKPFIQQEELARSESAVADAQAALTRAKQELPAAQQRLAAAQEQEIPGHPVAPAVADARDQAERTIRAVRFAELRLVAAEAERTALRARVAADALRHGRQAGDPGEAARAAYRAEQEAIALGLQEKQEQAALALEQAQRKNDAAALAKAKQQVEKLAADAKAAAARAAQDAATYTPLTPIYPTTSTGRRKALAEWMVDRKNPLAARVAVNHIWLRHFGRPLVETVFDFGRNGARPTHPELLDWLAVEFMESGWSMKHLHRLIVTSAAYRQSSASVPQPTADPDNRWLGRFPARRLEAEAVRDSILHTAGEMDSTLGGPVLERDQEPTSRRRSLYFSVYPEDGGHLQFLDAFDPPDPCDCYRRSESVLPQQALTLTNSRLLLDHSRILARKLNTAVADENAFIVAAFEQVLTRRPTEPEVTACREFLVKQTTLLRGAAAADADQRAREGLVRALFNHGDFLTMR